MNIGIIGGGQLGMMMAEASKKYGHKIIGLDPNPNCSLSRCADEMVVASYENIQAFELLVSKSDVITYEFENVELSMIEKHIEIIPQKSKGLLKSKNRLIEKVYASKLNIPTVNYLELKHIHDIFYPSIIKTTTGGYDGKGQHRILCKDDIDHFPHNAQYNYIIEALVDFDYEISVIATRDQFGEIVTFPIPVNTHKNGILYESDVTKNLPNVVSEKAIDYTKRIINDLDYVGTLAVEYFVVGDDVIFNEFAPRPHNSGHYTIEGCTVSQFENHILAITNEHVETPKLLQPVSMINVLGQNMAFVEMCSTDNGFVHLYGKNEKKRDRKMAHITILGNSKSEIQKKINHITKEFL